MKKRNLVLFSVLLILLVLLSSCAGVGPRIGESDIAPVSASTSSTDVSVSSTSSETQLQLHHLRLQQPQFKVLICYLN